MNIFQRLAFRIALGYDAKAAVSLLETWREGKPTYSEVNYQNLTRQGYKKNELIYACLRKKAGSASQVRLRIRNRRTQKVISNHPLPELFAFPNPFMSEFDFLGWIVIVRDLAGRAVFLKQRDRAGRVARLWPLRPDWFRPIPDSQTFISGYQYTVPGQAPIIIPASEVLDFRLADPSDPYKVWSPVSTANRIFEVDNNETDFLKLFFEKGGVPPGLIKTVQKLRDEDIGDMRERWRNRYGGILGWLDPAILDRDADYKQIGMTFKDMGFDALDARSEARICAVLTVPPILVGAKVGLDRSTYSNYKEARSAWWEDDLVPMYVDFLDTINNQLIRVDYPDEDIEAFYDFSEVPALREERLALWQRANEGLRMGGIKVNEYRAEIGLDEVPEGDIYLRQMNLAEVHPDGTIVTYNAPPEPSPVDIVDTTVSEAPAMLSAGGKYIKAALPDKKRTKYEKILTDRLMKRFNQIIDDVEEEQSSAK